jgi:tetratricopeptide (TPR) repeat protein
MDLSMRGGAGTLRGVDYQVSLAVGRALEMMQRQIDGPHLSLTITVEALLLADGESEKWDFATADPSVVHEAKVKPTAEDIRSFLARASQSVATGMTLIYGEASGTTFKALEYLKRIHDMAGEDPDRFRALLHAGSDSERNLAALLDPDPFAVLHRISLENIPPGVLEQNMQFQARLLAGEQSADLISLLYETLSSGASKRRPRTIGSLTRLALTRGIAFRATSETSSELPHAAKAMLLLLDRLERPLPADVLAAAVGIEPGEVPAALSALHAAGAVEMQPGLELWAITALPAPVVAGREPEILSRALKGLMAWTAEHPVHRAQDAAVDAVLQLAERLEQSDPTSVALSFRVVDKHIKRRGDRRQVFSAADRAIRAAKNADRSEQVASAEAIALICGRSWVFQRVGDLDRARADGMASLQIGEQLGDDRNTAFCHKCLGRMCRMQAEEAENLPERTLYLTESENHLTEAIARFSNLGDEPEVGDAHSLLGRTQLLAGAHTACEQSITAAGARLHDPRHKDYFDLQILRGDLAAARGQTRAAREIYSDVLETLPVGAPSEIRARALAHRGQLAGSRAERHADLNDAADIYEQLGEFMHAANPRILAMIEERRMPTRDTQPEIARMLEAETPATQVLAVRLHEQVVSEGAYRAAAVAFRQEATTSHWSSMIERARRQVTVIGKFW